jgi:uncharacterized protein YijF (DUF1287 family)
MNNTRQLSSITRRQAIAPSLLGIWLLLLAGLTYAEVSAKALVDAAFERTRHQVTYDGRYVSIPYPGGDVPENIGVCTDVVIRAYRSVGIDLQQKVHEDMRSHFQAYPSKRIWGLNRPDTNIDHRRVPNLQAFFSRHGEVLPISDNASDYQAGDLVTWMLPGNLPHIGIVTDRKSPAGTPIIVHNIGWGPKADDILFAYKITGHYRYLPLAFPD